MNVMLRDKVQWWDVVDDVDLMIFKFFSNLRDSVTVILWVQQSTEHTSFLSSHGHSK